MPRSILALVSPDNTPGGSILTFAIPLGLFAVVATILFLRLTRPHRRVPDRPILVVSHEVIPDAEAAAAAAVAAGLPTAAGGGGAESGHEPAGAARASAAEAEPGNVSPRDSGPAGTQGPDQQTSAEDRTEAGE